MANHQSDLRNIIGEKFLKFLPQNIQEQLENQDLVESDDRKFSKKFKVWEKIRKEKRKRQREEKKCKRLKDSPRQPALTSNKRRKYSDGNIINHSKSKSSATKKFKIIKDDSEEIITENYTAKNSEHDSSHIDEDSIDSDERRMRWLEKKLGIKSEQKIDKVFQEDGLDAISKNSDAVSSVRTLGQYQSGSEEDSMTVSSDDDEKAALNQVHDINLEAQIDDKCTTKQDIKYIPPQLRAKTLYQTEELTRIQRLLQGLLNRLSESNIESILMNVEELYRKYTRHDVTSTITQLILHMVSSRSNLLDQFVALYATFVAALYKILGIDFCSHFIQTSIEEFQAFHRKYSSASTLNNATTDSGKECTNLIILVSALYNFQVISYILVYDLIRIFIAELNELNVELLLKVIKSSGFQLRQDDPSALKEIIQQVQTEISKKDPSTISSRTKFMIETITNLKNNRIKEQKTISSLDSTINLKKFLSNLGKRIHVKGYEPLRVSLGDINSIETKGKWWLVGASWKANSSDDHNDSTVSLKPLQDNAANEPLIILAKQQKMNTDVRRSIFIVLMSSEDYVDAFERLLKLNLKDVQEREVPRVLLHCCGNEKIHNPYYDLIAERLCAHDYGFRVTFQYCLWDFLRECGENDVGGMELIQRSRMVDHATKMVPLRKIVNLAKLYAWVLSSGELSINILKTVSFNKLQAQSRVFFQLLFSQIIILSQRNITRSSSRMGKDRQILVDIFGKVLPNLALAQGILFFVKQYLKSNEILKNDADRAIIKWGCSVIEEPIKIIKNRFPDLLKAASPNSKSHGSAHRGSRILVLENTLSKVGRHVATAAAAATTTTTTTISLSASGPNPILQTPMIQQQYGLSNLSGLGQLSIFPEVSLSGANTAPGVIALSHRMMPQQNPQQQYNTSGLQGNAKIPWAVSPEEKSQYREIFKAWDTAGLGYISDKSLLNPQFILGEKGREVFSQSGLPANVLMQIWLVAIKNSDFFCAIFMRYADILLKGFNIVNFMDLRNLADPSNQGKLNQDEFAVAMHLIYRKLNGYDVPTSLPPELIPPSSRDFAESVDLVKNILATDLHNQRTGLSPQISTSSYIKSRSFTNNPTIDIRTDGVSYKHEDKEIGYVSSARRRVPSVTRETSPSYSSRSESGRDESTTNLSDLKKQIHEKEILLDALSYSAETAPISSYDSNDIEEFKRKIRDLQSQIAGQKSHSSQDWIVRKAFTDMEELNSLIDKHHSLEFDLNNMIYDIPDSINKIRETDNKVAEAKLDLFKLRESHNSSSDFSSIGEGSMTEADKIKAKATAMLQARMAAITGNPVPLVGSGSDASAVRRLEEETIKVNADKTTREQRVSDVERIVSRLQDFIIRVARERDEIESKIQKNGIRFAKEDKEKWNEGIGVSEEARRFIKDLEKEDSRGIPKIDYTESDYESRDPSYGDSPPKSSKLISKSTTSYSSYSISSQSSSSKAKSPEERAAFIKAEAERRMQERLKALGVTPPVAAAKSTPVSRSSSISDRLAREKAETAERIERAEKEAAERERTRSERLLAEKQKKADEEAERTRRVEEYERREAERRKQWLAEAEELEKVKGRKAREKEEAARALELELERKRLEDVERDKREKEERLARIKKEAAERAAEEERYREEQKAILENAQAAREQARKLEEEAKQRDESLKLEAERLKIKKEESIWQVRLPNEANIVQEKNKPVSTNPFLKFGAPNKPEETMLSQTLDSTNPFFRIAAAEAASSISNLPSKEAEQDDWDVVDKDEGDSDEDDFRMPGNKEFAAKIIAKGTFNSGIKSSSDSITSEAFANSTSTIPFSPITSKTLPASSLEEIQSTPTPLFTIPVAPPFTTSFIIPTPPNLNVPVPPPPPPTNLSPTNLVSNSAASNLSPTNSLDNPSIDGRGALLNQIQLGKKLKPTKTHDRSIPQTGGNEDSPSNASSRTSQAHSGSVGPAGLGGLFSDGIPTLKSRGGVGTGRGQSDDEIFANKFHAERSTYLEKLDRRISTDWFGSLALDQLAVEEPPKARQIVNTQTTLMEEKDEIKPLVRVESPSLITSSIEQDVDFNEELHVKTMFSYRGTSPDDLQFDAGVTFIAHPSKDKKNADWWYGVLEATGKKGWFPKNYVQLVREVEDVGKPESIVEEVEICKAKVLWDYKARNEYELDVKQGNILSILNKSLGDWWKAEYEGAKGVVPANYVEEVSSSSDKDTGTISSQQSSASDSETEDPFDSISFDNEKNNKNIVSPVSIPYTSHNDEKLLPILVVGSTTSLKTNKSEVRTRSPSPTRLFGSSPITPVPWIDPNERHLSINALSDAGLLPAALGTRPDSPGFAGPRPISQTWSGFMDNDTIESLPKEERKRQEGIFELITTEQSYLRDLQMIVADFYSPLQNLLDTHELSTLFSNIEDILLCNTEILSDLEQRQRDEGFFVDTLGDILVKHVENLRCYVVYCGNQMNASKFLQKKRIEDSRFDDFLKQKLQDPRTRLLDLSSYLLKPLQRITRYPLLFRQILHYTEKDNPDHQNIIQSLNIAEDILEQTNEAAREQENQVKIAEIAKSVDLEGLEEKLDLKSLTGLVGKRQFVMEGPLQKAKSNRKLHGYLFNDLLILAQPSRHSAARGYKYSLYKLPIPLNEIFVLDINQDECFQIVHIAEKINLRARDVSVKRQWINQIETARGYCLGIEQKNQNKDCIGTLRAVIYEGVVPFDPYAKEKPTVNSYCQARLNRQVFKTKVVKETINPRWNQVLLFSVTTLDDTLKLSLFNYDKHTQNEYLGQAEIGLRLLETYDNRETEKITLHLKDVPPGRPIGSISIYLSYRPTFPRVI
ncbi:hypothetical protein G9A89_022178 [Geosiphon pyriformis]|nr:hypothetical protein G9A89_022178 [Geosiphon pyriformis]